MVFSATAQGSPTSVISKNFNFSKLNTKQIKFSEQNKKFVSSNLDNDKHINDAVKSSYIYNNKEDTKTHPGPSN